MTYNRMFTLHGVVMVFLFMIPAIPSGFGNFVLPMMIGAEDVAFPRLNLASFYIYLAGAAFALWGMIHGGADTGWTFYAPYATTTPHRGRADRRSASSSSASRRSSTGLNFIVTVHTMRGPGLTWIKLPLFVWSIYATSDHPGARDAGPRHHRCSWSRSSTRSASASSIRRSAATRCSSSTCSGSTRTRPSTS